MRTAWNLDDLYLGFDDPIFKLDLKTAEGLKDKYTELVQTLLSHHEDELKSLELYLATYAEDLKLIRKLGAFGHLTFATQSKSQDALTLKSKVQKISSDLTASSVAFKTWIKDVKQLEVQIGRASCRERV